MASKRQLEEQDSREIADADDNSKRPRLPDPSGEGTSGLNTSNQQPEDAKDNSSDEEDDDSMEDGCDRISRFPALVQDQVFEFLGVGDKVRMSQVCSSWSGAVFRPRHWSPLTVNLGWHCMSEEHVETMNERGMHQVKVVMCNQKNMKMLLKKLHSLSSLDLEKSADANVFFEAVKDVKVSGLTYLRIETSVDQHVLLVPPQLFRSFPNLQAFSFTGIVGSDLLEVMGRELPRLRSLSLSSTVPSSQLDIRGLENFSGLTDLILSSFRLEDFENLTQLNRKLRELQLNDCELLENGWVLVLSQMSSLEQLDLFSCISEIKGKELRSVCENLVNLKKFAFYFQDKYIKDRHLRSVAKLSSLQELALADFGTVTEGIGALRSLPHLRLLQLENFDDFTSRAVEHISQISSLQELCLTRGPHGRVLLETLRRGSCKLKVLSLYDIKGIKGEDMAYIAEMSSLRKLSLAYVEVGPTGMELLSKGTFTLEVLEHRSCDVTIEGLMPLFERQTCLRDVFIAERGIEDKLGIDFMRTILPNLEKWKVDTKVDAE